MKALFSMASGVLVASALGAVAIPAVANHSVADEPEPTLEIFPSQQPILIGQGQPKTVTLLGAVYDGDIKFGGTVSIVPKNPQATNCPIFLNGENKGVSIRRNSTNVPFQLTVRPARTHPLGTFDCTLIYSASQINPATRDVVTVATKGNEVRFQYTVKKKFVF